jgi:hypothetical protein
LVHSIQILIRPLRIQAPARPAGREGTFRPIRRAAAHRSHGRAGVRFCPSAPRCRAPCRASTSQVCIWRSACAVSGVSRWRTSRPAQMFPHGDLRDGSTASPSAFGSARQSPRRPRRWRAERRWYTRSGSPTTEPLRRSRRLEMFADAKQTARDWAPLASLPPDSRTGNAIPGEHVAQVATKGSSDPCAHTTSGEQHLWTFIPVIGLWRVSQQPCNRPATNVVSSTGVPVTTSA